MSLSSNAIVKKSISIELSLLLCQIGIYLYESISELSILFYWSICLIFHQCYTVLIAVALVLILKSSINKLFKIIIDIQSYIGLKYITQWFISYSYY